MLLASLTTNASAASLPLYGIQGVPVAPEASPADVDRALDAAHALHSKVIRVEVLWHRLEPRAAGVRDDAYLAAVDRVIDGAAARGMRTMLMVDSTPCWASSAPDSARRGCTGGDPNTPEVTRYPPSGTDGYVAVSTFLAARYGDRLAAFEIWNEPDQVNQQYWAGTDKVRRYVALAQAVYAPLKQANPQMTVLAGSFVGADGKWLEALYAAGIQGAYDALSVHFYDLTLYALRTTRAVQLAHGDHKPLWLGEFGFTSCYQKGGPAVRLDHVCVTRSAQRQDLVDTLRAVARHAPYVRGAIVYTLTDQSPAYQFGLLDQHGRRKPAFAGVADAFRGRGRIARPRLHLRVSGGRLVVSGTASQVDVLALRVRQGGVLRYRAVLRTSRTGRFRVVLPPQLGTHGTVTVQAGWTGSASSRR